MLYYKNVNTGQTGPKTEVRSSKSFLIYLSSRPPKRSGPESTRICTGPVTTGGPGRRD